MGKKDLDGLASRREEGFETMLAVLGGRLTDEWIFLPIPGTDLQVNASTDLVFLRPFTDSELGQVVEEHFVHVVDRYGIVAADGGQAALNEILLKQPSYALA